MLVHLVMRRVAVLVVVTQVGEWGTLCQPEEGRPMVTWLEPQDPLPSKMVCHFPFHLLNRSAWLERLLG